MHITFHGNVSWKKSSFGCAKLDVVLAIQFSCRRIKLRFVESVSFGVYVRCICIEDFAMDQATFVSTS